MDKIIESLSPLERKILPLLGESVEQIERKTKLDSISIRRALMFLENKNIVKTTTKEIKEIILGTNGIYYKKSGLPERRLILSLEKNKTISLSEATKIAKLSENELKISIGVLKRKNIISLTNGKISLLGSKETLTKKMPEENFIESLPRKEISLTEQEKIILKELLSRKDIVEIETKKTLSYEITELGEKIKETKLEENLIEDVTPEIIKNFEKNNKFRRYDVSAPVPKIFVGKKHFVNQSVDYAKKIWTELGFKEMSGPMVDSSFWIFDALFTPQDHPVREMQDTFFISKCHASLPEEKIVKRVKEMHEKSWNYKWKEENAKKVALRTHTTSLSARKIASLKEIPAKYFAIGKAFRNETIDWSHGIEFYQTEGIVIDENANFTHLLGYLKEFYKKMGFEKIRFRPSFFPYTEPSVEVDVFHPEKKIWFELGGAGMIRPEVTIPLFGKEVPILAWGQGLDRMIMDFYKIKDLRELYNNNLSILRNKKVWTM